MGPLVAAHLERRGRGEKHPVWDFLFNYYSLKPSHLARWSPGAQVLLRGDAREFSSWKEFRVDKDGARLDLERFPTHRMESLRSVIELLRATSERAPFHGCFGLHEWAMVYRTGGDRRHASTPLRLGVAGTDAVVAGLPLRCTHADAYRFFSPAARPRNATSPSPADRLATEQPGCLHTTMDLYRWAYRLAPATPAELVADCLDLAVSARELDMRAGPYDLTALGLAPVRVETARGRAEYAAEQAGLARAAAPLRAALVDLVDGLLDDRRDGGGGDGGDGGGDIDIEGGGRPHVPWPARSPTTAP